MTKIARTLSIFISAISVAGIPGGQAVAQASPVEFRVVPTDRNPTSCRQFDATLSRVHTFTPTADGATLRMAGGISINMRQTSPNVFTGRFNLGSTTLDAVADTSKSPKTLDVSEPRLGCRWNAVAP